MSSHKPTAPKRRKPLWLAVALTAILLAALPLFIWYGYAQYQMPGVACALLAFAICWTAGVSALLVASIFESPQLALAGLMASMMIRLGLPMGAVVFFQSSQHLLLDSGLNGMIVAYYLLTLAVETPLTILLVRPNPTPTGAT